MTSMRGHRQTVGTFDVGGTHVSGALVDRSTWHVIPDSSVTLALDSAATSDVVLDALAMCAEQVLDRAADRAISTQWGVAMPGPFDYRSGIGRFEGVAKFASLNGVNVGAALVDRLAPRVDRFAFINDANAYMLGEWLAGAALGLDRVIGITLGTGVGSAFLADGVIIDEGDVVPPGGYVYLLEVDGRPLEETVSRRALRRSYATLVGTEVDLDVREIAELAREGDPAAARVMSSTYERLGQLLAPWATRFDAQAIVVGGSIARAWDLVAPALREGLGDWPGELRQSLLFADAALIGAASAAVKG